MRNNALCKTGAVMVRLEFTVHSLLRTWNKC